VGIPFPGWCPLGVYSREYHSRNRALRRVIRGNTIPGMPPYGRGKSLSESRPSEGHPREYHSRNLTLRGGEYHSRNCAPRRVIRGSTIPGIAPSGGGEYHLPNRAPRRVIHENTIPGILPYGRGEYYPLNRALCRVIRENTIPGISPYGGGGVLFPKSRPL
jgi:hypothetical protein